jgi:hypothetical protein
MPKRSNEFQKLVYLVRTNLAAGATVTESKLLRDRLTRALREVDVCIEGTVGAYPVMVCIECRDHKRVADVQWVDALRTKHSRLPTNALMLASKSGFTPEAKRAAALYGIETFKLEDVEVTDFPALLGAYGTAWTKAVSITPTKVIATVPAFGDLSEESVVLLVDNCLYFADGEEVCTALGYVQAVAHSIQARDYLTANGAAEHKWFTFRMEPARANDGRPLYIRKLEPEVLREIVSLEIIGSCEIKIASVTMQRGRLGDISVTWGTATLHGQPSLVVATHDADGKKSLSIAPLDASHKPEE